MRAEAQLFLMALMFFTRIPCPVRFDYKPEFSGQAAKYLPLIGFLVGSASAAVFWLAHEVFPQSVSVLLSMVASILLTGGFHEDGFADACDGFGGGWTREDVLRIMQDSRVGAFGAMGIALLLLLKLEVLSTLPASLVPVALIVGHTLSRLAAISLVQAHLYLRREEEGKCHGIAQPMSSGNFVFALIIGLMPIYWLGFMLGGMVLITAVVSRFVIGSYLFHRIGGYTGDCLGAAQQVTEVIIYLSLLATVKFVWPA